jgi:hypothetical protein
MSTLRPLLRAVQKANHLDLAHFSKPVLIWFSGT